MRSTANKDGIADDEFSQLKRNGFHSKSMTENVLLDSVQKQRPNKLVGQRRTKVGNAKRVHGGAFKNGSTATTASTKNS